MHHIYHTQQPIEGYVYVSPHQEPHSSSRSTLGCHAGSEYKLPYLKWNETRQLTEGFWVVNYVDLDHDWLKQRLKLRRYQYQYQRE
jgi:hypothetical protein